MFARTKRLTLRPGWPEDAPVLRAAIAHHPVAERVCRLPWPYSLADAEAFLARPRSPAECALLILAHEGKHPRIVGGIGIDGREDGHHLGYWLTPAAWGQGYATEAGRAVVDMARHALGLQRLIAGHFLDNPASGRVLAKLGFLPSGEVSQHWCKARGHSVPYVRYALALRGGSAARLAA
jgi:RimJ/RimL family protein N-acetyltransferase